MVTNLRRLFKKDIIEQAVLPFKQYHALNTLPPEKLADLLSFSEQRQFPDLCPELTGKRILFFSRQSTDPLLANIPTDQALVLAIYRTGNVSFGKATSVNEPSSNLPNVYTLNGTLKPLPFRKNYFDLLLLPFASGFGGDILDHLPSLARLMNNGGRAVISVVHPAFEIFLKNQNPASTARSDSSLEAYFTAFRDNDLYLETLAEGKITRENKTFFPSLSDDILGIPLVLFLRVVKYVKS